MSKRRQIPSAKQYAFDAAVGAGHAFLVGELEKVDPKLREPLTSTQWPRDIVCKTGGGWVEGISSLNMNFATTGSNQNGIVGGQTTDIPVMQVDVSKDRGKVFSWGQVSKVSYIDKQKLKQIARNIEEMIDKGIRLNHDKTLDQNVYEGFDLENTYGLINNPNITITAVENGTGGSSKWFDKTPDEILADINKAMVDTWVASGNDLTGMANHILVPPHEFAMLATRKVSEAGNMSILKYLEENNIGRNQGVGLSINPLPYLKGAGTGGTNRMVAYVNNVDRIRFHETVTLHRAMTQISVESMSYVSSFLAQFSEVEWLYYTPAIYVDGI